MTAVREESFTPQRRRALERANEVKAQRRAEREPVRQARREATASRPAPECIANAELRAQALKRATEIHIARAALRRQVEKRQRSLAEALADPPDEILNAEVRELICWLPGMGPSFTAKVLRRLKIPHGRRVIDMDAREWRAVREIVREIERRIRR